VPLTKILHAFYAVTWNYGLAIILLTFLVRGCMFPVSRKQVLSSQKMQVIQPELKKIQEKYKNNVEARTKAMQELYKKHHFNPMSGCLVVFIQMPIFIGLYRALMVDVELRDAYLFSDAVRWCSNLAAPDMLYDWHALMPDWVNNGIGIFGLGPYFNLLPILTVGLMIWQQKVLTPPPTDEQAIMMQKMMKYMMLFFGLMFFKVASGLCIYFIVSSLWSLVERQFLPKTAPPPAAAAAPRGRPKK
jgi:YidC/Oxa1 family membrane protein insertase